MTESGMSRFAVALCAALTALLTQAGCSAPEENTPAAASQPTPAPSSAQPPSSTPAPTTSAPAPELVSWADTVCAASRLFRKKPAPLSPDRGSGAAADPHVARGLSAVESLEEVVYLNEIPDFTRASLELLGTLGSAPVAGGAEVVAGYRGALQRLLPEVEKYRTREHHPGNAAKVQKAARLVTALKSDGPDLASLTARDPAFAQAQGTAVNCGPRGMFPRPGRGVPIPR